MPRPLWSGSLSFGLVNVPIQLRSGTKDLDLHFHQLHEKDDAPIETKRVSAKTGREVAYDDIARSFEFDNGDEVIVTADELENLQPERTRTIEIEQFVDLADVDPIYFDHPYLLSPSQDNEGALRAYRLLVEVMSKTDRAALGRFVMRTKEYLAIIQVRDGALALTTMRFHDEVRAIKDVDTGGKGKKSKPTPAAVKRAAELIEKRSVDWDPERYEDNYRERLKAVVKGKQRGKTVKVPEPVDEPEPVTDLMAALKESLKNVKARA